jgi:hypothetical protein
VRAFLANHPKGAHAEEARTLLERLAWDSTKKDSIVSLRAYLKEFPRGPNAGVAASQIADLEWQGVDQKNPDALRRFVAENAGNPHIGEANRLIGILDKQRQQAEQDRLKKLQAQKELDAHKTQIAAALERFNAAFRDNQRGQLRAVWPSARPNYFDAIGRGGIELRPTGDPSIAGDQASIVCNQISTISRSQSQAAVKVILRRVGSDWQIADITKP